jgi:hypothetical protein
MRRRKWFFVSKGLYVTRTYLQSSNLLQCEQCSRHGENDSDLLNREHRQRKYLKQSIMLTGLGGHSFAQCIDNIYAIQDMFAPEFPQDALEDWTPSRCGEFDAVDISNRYFTSRYDMNGEAPIPFQSNVDPDRILTNALSNDFVHLQDNEVEYYEAMQEPDEPIR